MMDRHIDDEALCWAIRMAEPDADWDAFLMWLEGDATRTDRYDRAVAMLDDAATVIGAATITEPMLSMATASPSMSVPASRPVSGEENPTSLIRSARRRWIGGAIAAALTGAIGLGVWTQAPQSFAVSTAPGERRIVSLADGSSIVLAGASAVRLDRRDPRIATVERGQMLFRVRHDADRPFVVRVAAMHLVDLGTVFDVKIVALRTRVSVAEGAVMVDPDGAALRLGPGQAVVADGGTLQRSTVAAADVGSWQDGRLAYDGAPLDEVAADLSRQTGRRVVAGSGTAGRTFRGTLDVATIRHRPDLLGTLLDVTIRQDAEGWTLEPRR